MNIQSFLKHRYGSLVKHGSDETAYFYYLPNNLTSNFQLEQDQVNKLLLAVRCLAELKGISRNINDPFLFVKPFFVREAQQSSSIEGKHTQIDRLFMIQAEQTQLSEFTTHEIKDDEKEVTNYILSMKYGYDYLQERLPTVNFIKELQLMLLDKVRGSERFYSLGNFRQTQNWIGYDGCTLNDADFVPPHYDYVDSLMRDLLTFISDSINLQDCYELVRISMIHYQFEAIHPFVDGNGRVGRMLVSLLLHKMKLIDYPLLHMSGYFENQRDRYYQLLYEVSSKGAVNAWIEFFLDGVIGQAKNTIRKIKQIQDWSSINTDIINKTKSNVKVLLLIKKLTENPIISVNIASRITGYTYQGAKKIIELLVSQKILKFFDTFRHEKYYICEDIVNILLS